MEYGRGNVASGDETCSLIPARFPANNQHAASIIASIPTEATVLYFVDKILVTICQDGCIAHWVHVPLENKQPDGLSPNTLASGPGSDTLPMTHLTASTLLGGRTSELDVLGHLYAAEIATLILTRDPDEKRLLVVGIGLKNFKASPDSFMQNVDLIMSCL